MSNSSPDLPTIFIEAAATVSLTQIGQWVLSRVSSGQKKALEKEHASLRKYVGRLTRRVAEVEHRIGSTEQAQERIAASLEDPDFWAVFGMGAFAAGRTADEAKLELLARAVAERLLAEAESVNALAGAQAVEIIPKLTRTQIEFLGLAALVYAIRPALPILQPGDSHDHDNQRLEEEYAAWLDENLKLYQELRPVREADFAHLVATSSLVYQRGRLKDLRKILSGFPDGAKPYPTFAEMMSFQGAFHQHRTAFWLEDFWNKQLYAVTLTTAGVMIGIAAHDWKAGTNTQLDLSTSPFAAYAAPSSRYSSEDEDIYRAWERFRKRLELAGGAYPKLT